MHTRSKAFRSTLQVMAGAVALALVLTSGRASCWAAQPAAAATASDPVGKSPPSEAAPASSPAAGTPASTAEGYAAREAQAKDLENFRGGDLVIIGSTGLLILLLVLLILVVA